MPSTQKIRTRINEAPSNVVALALSPFFLGAIVELAGDVGLGLSASSSNDVRVSLRQQLVTFRSIADKIALNSLVGILSGSGSLYMSEVRPVLDALIDALQTVGTGFQALGNASLTLDIVNAGEGGAVVRATLIGLAGKLRVRMEAQLSGVTDVEALAATLGPPPAIIKLELIEAQLVIGKLGQVDVLSLADAVHEATQDEEKLRQVLESFFGKIGAFLLGDSPPPQPAAAATPLPSQQVKALLVNGSSRGNLLIRLVLRRFLRLLPVTEIRWRGGPGLGIDAHVAAAAAQSTAIPNGLPTSKTTPWPVAADEAYAKVYDTFKPGMGAKGPLSLGTFVRVVALERYELEFEPSQWSPWAALTSEADFWKGAAPCVFSVPRFTLQSAPPLLLEGQEGSVEPAFLGSYMASGTHGRPAFVFKPWQLVQALQQGVAALMLPNANGDPAAVLQALVAAASADGKHRMARIVVSAMPHQSLAWLADRVVWLYGKKKGATAMAALPLDVATLVAHLKAFSAVIGTVWKLPAKPSPLEQERRRQLLVPMVAGAEAEVHAQWLRAEWVQLQDKPGAGYPGDYVGPHIDSDKFEPPIVPIVDPLGGKGPKWRPNG